jgi:signal transduction histidine kinase
MWSFSKRTGQTALSHAELESMIFERKADLQNLSQRLLKAQDEERRRVARDLHDSTGQTLAALKISASFLQEQCKQYPYLLPSVSEVVALADQAIDEIRTMSYLLHPPLLDEVGFSCAAEWYVEGFAKRSGITVTLDFANERQRLPIAVETALFRVLQESLTNVHRHSKAKQVRIRYLRQPESTILEIRDFGCGIAAERLSGICEVNGQTGVGVAGMRERMNELNGRLELESDGNGTSVRAIIPQSITVPFAQAIQGNQVSSYASERQN